MKSNKIILSLVMIFAGLMPQVAQALDVRDSLGRTPLMNYVIVQEAKIAQMRLDEKVLWNNCYEYVLVPDGGFTTEKIDETRSRSVPTYTTEVRRKISCTDQDVLNHKACQLFILNLLKIRLIQ